MSIVKIITFKNRIFLVAILVAIYLSSCKTDEFKWKELGIKEEWNTEIVVPLFSGNMEFNDFITDWYNYENNYTFDEPLTTLEYSEYYHKVIPTNLMFERSVVIDSFPLLVQGEYEMSSIALEFYVTNASPYPLNLEMQFYNKLDSVPADPPIEPDVFLEGNIVGNVIEPVKTMQTVSLSTEQVNSFNNGNRVRFTSWYTNNGFIKDTLSAHYPIDISIVLRGRIKGKDEN